MRKLVAPKTWHPSEPHDYSAECCSKGKCRRPRALGMSMCIRHAEQQREKNERRRSAKKQPLADFLLDPSRLPKKPPGKS